MFLVNPRETSRACTAGPIFNNRFSLQPSAHYGRATLCRATLCVDTGRTTCDPTVFTISWLIIDISGHSGQPFICSEWTISPQIWISIAIVGLDVYQDEYSTPYLSHRDLCWFLINTKKLLKKLCQTSFTTTTTSSTFSTFSKSLQVGLVLLLLLGASSATWCPDGRTCEGLDSCCTTPDGASACCPPAHVSNPRPYSLHTYSKYYFMYCWTIQ